MNDEYFPSPHIYPISMNIQTAIKLGAWLIAGFACQILSHAEPAELTAARLAYETKLAVPKGKLDAALAARGKQYAVVIKAYEQGKQTNGFGANATKVPPEARDARRLMEGDFLRLRAAAAPEGRRLSVEYVKALEGIERKLTMQKDVGGAVEIRKERTAILQDGLDPFASDATQSSALHRQLLNATWKWWKGETITFQPGGKARWSSGKELFTWKVTDPAQRIIEGLTPSGKKYTITFDSAVSSGSIAEEGAGTRKTSPILKDK
jgi:hypothetical protein